MSRQSIIQGINYNLNRLRTCHLTTEERQRIENDIIINIYDHQIDTVELDEPVQAEAIIQARVLRRA